MMDSTLFWVAICGALTFGLAYYRWVVQPSQREERLEGAVRAFGAAIELRFPSHAGLTEAVAAMANRVALRLGLGPRRRRRLDRAVRLRDIGLCAIPYRLVNGKNWEEWTLSETATYDCHPQVGGAILETVPSLHDLADTVRLHHAPYAQGAPNPPIPLEARIVKGCAEFVWYRRHRGWEAASEHLRMGSGGLYDPDVVRAILDGGEREPSIQA